MNQILVKYISIHAPARGATSLLLTNRTLGIISIHAPARGATFKYLKNSVIEVCISIHAPARGATQISVSLYIIYIHFNPRSREGSDQKQNEAD